jgi:hypothetical protein
MVLLNLVILQRFIVLPIFVVSGSLGIDP